MKSRELIIISYLASPPWKHHTPSTHSKCNRLWLIIVLLHAFRRVNIQDTCFYHKCRHPGRWDRCLRTICYTASLKQSEWACFECLFPIPLHLYLELGQRLCLILLYQSISLCHLTHSFFDFRLPLLHLFLLCFHHTFNIVLLTLCFLDNLLGSVGPRLEASHYQWGLFLFDVLCFLLHPLE